METLAKHVVRIIEGGLVKETPVVAESGFDIDFNDRFRGGDEDAEEEAPGPEPERITKKRKKSTKPKAKQRRVYA